MQPDFSSLYASLGSRVADLPGFGTNWGSFADLGMAQYEERVHNSWMGLGFRTNEDLGGPPGARLRGFGVRYPDADGTVRGGNWTLEEAIRNSEGVGTVFASWDDAYVDGDMDPDAIPLPDDFRVRVENRLKTVQPGQSKSVTTLCQKLSLK